MAKVVVRPEVFELVEFDSGEIIRIAEEVADAVGLAADVPVEIEVDETLMMGRITSKVEGGVVYVNANGGAFEDLRKARKFSEPRCRTFLGHAFQRAADRLDAAFGDPPPDPEIPVDLDSAWATYIEGRLERAGLPTRMQRRIYHFRVRHGFGDSVDQVFNRLWSATGLTWADIQAASAEASAARVTA